MAARERDDDKPFLSRWSQRKRQAEEETRVAEVTAVSEAEPEAEPAEIDPAELPDIDSLEAGSDFSVFLRKGVPNALKQKALRRLWQVDPAFKHICMLDDYNQDFTDAAMVVPNLKTVYQVGRGMVLPEDELETTAAAEEAEEAPGAAIEESAPPSPAAPEQSETPKQVAAAESPPIQSDVADSNLHPPDPRESASSTVGQDAARSARRRRWGDIEV